jgi:hypothetical protein
MQDSPSHLPNITEEQRFEEQILIEQQKEIDKQEFRAIVRNQSLQVVISFACGMTGYFTTIDDADAVFECSR